MPDSPIHDLTRASRVDSDDLLVLEQDGEAKKLEGQLLLNYVYERLDIAHGATSILPITSAPSSYTTPIQGFTPAYRISLSNVVSQSGVNSVLVGDQLRYDSFLYPVGYVDTTYAYLGQRVDIRGAASGSNQNLLDNGWFTIDQRHATAPFEHDSYIADRWVVASSTQCSKDNNSRITINSGAIRQTLEGSLITRLSGKEVTASLLVAGETVYSGTTTFPSSSVTGEVTLLNGGGYSVSFNRTNHCFYIRNAGASGLAIRAVKLERGSVSTLANDSFPEYISELRRCQRYFYRLENTSSNNVNMGFATLAGGATSAYAQLTLPVPMRVPPTNTSGTVSSSEGTVTPSSGACMGVSPDTAAHATATERVGILRCYDGNSRVTLTLTIPSATPLVQGQNYQVFFMARSWIDFSADIPPS